MKSILFAALCALCFFSCSKSIESMELQRAEASEDFNKALSSMIDELGDEPIKSLMVLQHGKVICERYFNGFAPDSTHHLWSASKTFTSFAVGFACSEGKLSLDDKLVDIFPEETKNVLDTLSNKEYADNLKACTIRDLMVMGCGHAEDPTEPLFRQFASESNMSDMSQIDSLASAVGVNTVQEFFKFPFVYKPGTKYCYNSIGTYMLSVAVTRATGERINDYLDSRLWKKLGIEKPEWFELSGANCGGWGLNLTTEEMAKVGQMMLDKGMYKGQQVLPKGFIEEASKPFFKWDIPSGMKPSEARYCIIGYGYQTWINTDAFLASGHAGQFIHVLPEYDAVIATTADYPSYDPAANAHIWKYLVPVLQDECLEKVEIQGARGTLRGYIEKPENVTGKIPTVIICHGLTGYKSEMHLAKVADKLKNRGIASVRFDFNGHGESDGDFYDHTVANEVEDAKLIYEFVSTLPWVDETRIGITGHSQGGLVTSVTAGDLGQDAFKAVCLMAPAALIHTTVVEGNCFGQKIDMENIPDSIDIWGHPIGREYFRAAYDMDVYNRAKEYEGPVMILQGDKDSERLYEDALRYKDYYKDCEIVILKNHPHGYDPSVREAGTIVADWFASKL